MSTQLYNYSIQTVQFLNKYRTLIPLIVIALLLIAMMVIPGVVEAGPAPSGSTCGNC